MPIPAALVLLQLTFQDNFVHSTIAPDPQANWMTTYPYGGISARTLPANDEAECYMNQAAGEVPFVQKYGLLNISATKADDHNPCGLPYDSGLITTFNSFNQLYGYFEVRAKMPTGQGLWPAFWLLPASNKYTAELDAFEVLGSDPSKLYFTVHGKTNGTWHMDSQALNVHDTSAAFHIYGVDWEADTTTLYIDGKVVASVATPQSMNTSMYMLLNLAVGGAGSWPGKPNAATVFPAHYQLDYVRAYATKGTVSVAGTRALPFTRGAATRAEAAGLAP
jgi:beta-glucanase (GH16 family)